MMSLRISYLFLLLSTVLCFALLMNPFSSINALLLQLVAKLWCCFNDVRILVQPDLLTVLKGFEVPLTKQQSTKFVKIGLAIFKSYVLL